MDLHNMRLLLIGIQARVSQYIQHLQLTGQCSIGHWCHLQTPSLSIS